MAVDDVFPRRNLPGDPETGQSAEPWGRAVENRVVETQRGVEIVSQELAGLNRSTASSLAALAAQLNNLPEVKVGFGNLTNFGLSSGVKFVQFNITVPSNKNTVSMSVQGNVQVLDATSGGLAVANAYIEVSGSALTWTTPLFSASKDAGASAVNNIIAASTGFKAVVTPGGSILVAMTINATNIAAYPTNANNFATLVSTAIFTNE